MPLSRPALSALLREVGALRLRDCVEEQPVLVARRLVLQISSAEGRVRLGVVSGEVHGGAPELGEAELACVQARVATLKPPPIGDFHQAGDFPLAIRPKGALKIAWALPLPCDAIAGMELLLTYEAGHRPAPRQLECAAGVLAVQELYEGEWTAQVVAYTPDGGRLCSTPQAFASKAGAPASLAVTLSAELAP